MTRVHAVGTQRRSSTRGAKVLVSPAVFVAVWWFVWAMHLINGTLALAFAGPYHFFSSPVNYAATAVLQIPVAMLRVSAWSYTALALLHWYSLGAMTWRSLRARQLSLHPPPPGKTARPCAGCVARLARLLWSPWRRSFGVDGLFGVNGRYFYVAFFTREALEVFFQSYQAAQLSGTMRRTWITHLAVLVVVANCIATPVIHHAMSRRKKQESAQRFVHLVADMALDFCSGVVIPLAVLLPLTTVYDASIGSFAPALVNDDTWFISTIAELRQFCITSVPDLFATMLPLLSVYACLSAAKQLVQRRQWTSTTTDRSERSPWVSIAVVAAAPSRLTRRFSSTASVFARLYTASHRHLDRAFHLLLAACVAVVSVFHARAHMPSTTTHVAGCRLRVHPWEATKAPCMVMQINCHRHEISGSAAEIAAVLEPLDRRMLRKLLLIHCPALEVPATLLEFNALTDIDLYNSSLVSWPKERAATPTTLASLTKLSWFSSPYHGFPAGLLHDNLPPSFTRFSVAMSNLTELPDELGDVWAHHLFDRFSVQFTQLHRLPATFHRLAVRKLRLVSNRLTHIDDSVLVTKRLTVLDVSGNPLTRWPLSIGDTSALVELAGEHTQILEASSQVAAWWHTRPGWGLGDYLFSMYGSPYCDTRGGARECDRELGNANGSYSWDLIAAQRTLDS